MRRPRAAADDAVEKGWGFMMGSIVTRVAGALLCAAVAAGPARAADKLKVGFVYVGPVADYGYSYQHDLSRKALAEALPARSRRPSSRTCRRPTASAPSRSSPARAPA